MDELTGREKEVYEYTKEFIKDRGYTPSMREIGVGIGLSSTNSVFTYFKSLINKGYIRQYGRRYTVKGLKVVDEMSEV